MLAAAKWLPVCARVTCGRNHDAVWVPTVLQQKTVKISVSAFNGSLSRPSMDTRLG